MGKKRNYLYAALLAGLLVLVYFQFRTWKAFDWATFWKQTRQVDPTLVLYAVVLIHLAYVLRAVRWKIFLRPVKRVSFTSLIAPTIVGFTGLALLGRAGEMIRPYVIARKHDLSFSSQLAVWTVERIFDIGAFTFLFGIAVFLPRGTRSLPHYETFKTIGLVLIAIVVAMVALAWLVRRSGEALAAWIEKRFSHLPAKLGERIASRVREFHAGLDTIKDIGSLFQLIGVSVLMWFVVAVAYKAVLESYPGVIPDLRARVLLLMASSMLGSLIAIPGVGGGSQLATISTLRAVFEVPPELAVSCGILLWLVTFVSVVPLGLTLAHQERLSLRKLSKESHEQQDGDPSAASPPA